MMDYEHWFNEGGKRESASSRRQSRGGLITMRRAQVREAALEARLAARSVVNRARKICDEARRAIDVTQSLRKQPLTPEAEQRAIVTEEAITQRIAAAQRRIQERAERYRSVRVLPQSLLVSGFFNSDLPTSDLADQTVVSGSAVDNETEEHAVFMLAVAVDLASVGRLSEGYTLLLDCLEIARMMDESPEVASDPEQREQLEAALDQYCRWFGVPIE